MTDTRNNPEDAYSAFMSMGQAEWCGLLASLITGTLTPAEQEGFDRAVRDRGKAVYMDATTYIEYQVEFRGKGHGKDTAWVSTSFPPTRLEHDEMRDVLGRALELTEGRNQSQSGFEWRVRWRVVTVEPWQLLEPGSLDTEPRAVFTNEDGSVWRGTEEKLRAQSPRQILRPTADGGIETTYEGKEL